MNTWMQLTSQKSRIYNCLPVKTACS